MWENDIRCVGKEGKKWGNVDRVYIYTKEKGIWCAETTTGVEKIAQGVLMWGMRCIRPVVNVAGQQQWSITVVVILGSWAGAADTS